MRDIDDLLNKIECHGLFQSTGETSGDPAFSLARVIGIPISSTGKATINGFNIKTTLNPFVSGGRVNLFAKVPDWKISKIKSTREFLELSGYDVDDSRRCLNCTVTSLRYNNQGLKLLVDFKRCLLVELYNDNPILCWNLIDLQRRLQTTQTNSCVLYASVVYLGGKKYYKFKEAVVCESIDVKSFVQMLNDGVITLDHLITSTNGRVTEKGPLFKCRPENFGLLFSNYVHRNIHCRL